MWTCGVFFHAVRHSSLPSYRYLLCSHYPRSGRWEPLQAVSSLPFVLSPSFFELFLTFWHQRMFLTHLQLPYLSPGTDRFSKEPWLFFTGEGHLETKIWVLDVLIAAGGSLLPDLSVDGAWKGMHVHVYI